MALTPSRSWEDMSPEERSLYENLDGVLDEKLIIPLRLLVLDIGQENLRRILWDIRHALTIDYKHARESKLTTDEIIRAVKREARLKARCRNGGRFNKVQFYFEHVKRMYGESVYQVTSERFQRMQQALANNAKKDLKRTSRWKLNKLLREAGLAPLPF